MADVVLAQTANRRDNARLGTDNVEVFKARPISPGSTSQQQHAIVQLMGNTQCGRLRASQRYTRGLFGDSSGCTVNRIDASRYRTILTIRISKPYNPY